MEKIRLAQTTSCIANCTWFHRSKFTKYSVLLIICTQFYHHGMDPPLLTQLSGHKNPNGLALYMVVSDYQHKDMCHRLQNSNLSEVAAIIPSHGVANNPSLPSTTSAVASGQWTAIPGQHVGANQVTAAPGSAMPDPKKFTTTTIHAERGEGSDWVSVQCRPGWSNHHKYQYA